MAVLPRDFYARDTRVVARALLGKVVVLGRRRARIVETEAYHGFDDAASHAFGGPTPRSKIMFGPPGHAYVYLIYGVWSCLNVVTGEEKFPSAVLIRAGQILGSADPREAAGPGKLCRALGIDRTSNGADLCATRGLRIEDDGFPAPEVRTGTRIGIDYAGASAQHPWRFWIAGHGSVSKKEPLSHAARRAPPRRARP
jgi:DNA-3-methyladenine glycosylase